MKKIKQNQENKNGFLYHLFLFCLLCVSFSMSACSVASGSASYGYDKGKELVAPRGGRADFDLSEGIRFKKRSNPYLGEIVTRIHPNTNLEKKPTAMFVPMALVQDNKDHYAISLGVSKLIWQSFLAEGTFETLEFANLGIPYNPEQFLSYAQQKGADFLIGGFINQYYDGGTAGDNRFAMELLVYHVETGNLIWSIHHNGILPYKADQDYAFFKIQHRMPMNPMSTLVTAIGDELAQLLHYWTSLDEVEEKKLNDDSYRNRVAPSAF